MSYPWCVIVHKSDTLTISVSVMTLCAISVERWYAICHPLRFHSTVRRARYIIAIIWVASACIAIPELITSTVIPLRPDTVLLSACYPALWGDEIIVIFQICLMPYRTGLGECSENAVNGNQGHCQRSQEKQQISEEDRHHMVRSIIRLRGVSPLDQTLLNAVVFIINMINNRNLRPSAF
ncbi:orexin receptor type 2-like [Mercenaria mercenaria]|uniref:orexin receptor type 2-like n=1 Tax=Mercenaria mercenaria TaxID=6596 RepID=UPI00234EF1B6|nr:orexin receptor type 2-like [Mercenaria mercenaria]